MEYTPDDFNGYEQFLTLGRLVTPRPVGWISTVDSSGEPNIAPYSFVSPLSVDPPVIGLSVAPHPDGSMKDTAQNVLDTDEFVYHLLTDEFLDQMNETARDVDHSEFDLIDVETTSCTSVEVPRIDTAPAWLECTTYDTHEIAETQVIYGEVERIGIADAFVDETDLPDVDAIEESVLGHLIDEHYTTLDLLEKHQPDD